MLSTSIHSSDRSTASQESAPRQTWHRPQISIIIDEYQSDEKMFNKLLSLSQDKGHCEAAGAHRGEGGAQTILVLGAINSLDVKSVTDFGIRGVHAANFKGRKPLPLLLGVGHPCIARLVRLDRDVVHAVASFASHLHTHRRPCRPAPQSRAMYGVRSGHWRRSGHATSLAAAAVRLRRAPVCGPESCAREQGGRRAGCACL